MTEAQLRVDLCQEFLMSQISALDATALDFCPFEFPESENDDTSTSEAG